jgi:uncharacterized OB-fold protein
MPPPYTVVAAELVEGPILITDIEAQPQQLHIGMPVWLSYRPFDTADGASMVLYQWALHDRHPPT